MRRPVGMELKHMNCQNSRLILASGSPRRRELLARMGYKFETCSPDVDEHIPGHARDVVRTLAERKARAAAEGRDSGVVIAADTLVSLDGAALGKPASRDDARRMLHELSGREHEVFTGVCVIDCASGREESRVAHGRPLPRADRPGNRRLRRHRRADGQGRRLRHSGRGGCVCRISGRFL